MTESKTLVPKRRFKEFEHAGAWEERKLGEVGVTYTGLSGKTKGDFGHGDGRYVTYLNVFSNPVANLSIVEPIEIDPKQNEVKTGDVFFTTSSETPNEVGMSSVWLGDCNNLYLNSFCFGYRPTANLDTYYLAYMLRSFSVRKKIVFLAQGISRYNISKNKLMEVYVFFPSLTEQLKIGSFFKQIDDLITLQQHKLEKTKALKSAYLSEMFPAEGERQPKRRFSGFTGDWERRTIGDFGYFYYGKSAPKWSVTLDAKTPCVRYGELYTKHSVKIDTIYSFTNISKENLKFSTGREVLVPRVGEDPLAFANCSWLSIPDVAIGEMISVYNTEQNPLFTAYMFNALLKHQFAKRVEGGNVSNLYYTYLEDIEVSFPDIEEQGKIASFFSDLDNLIDLHQRKLAKLQQLKKAYLNEMFV